MKNERNRRCIFVNNNVKIEFLDNENKLFLTENPWPLTSDTSQKYVKWMDGPHNFINLFKKLKSFIVIWWTKQKAKTWKLCKQNPVLWKKKFSDKILSKLRI